MDKVKALRLIVSLLKSIKQDPKQLESLKKETPKYLSISQAWAAKIFNRNTGAYENPIFDAGKARPEHIKDFEALRDFHGWQPNNVHYHFHDKPEKTFGNETYQVHPDGKLTFVHGHYDTSDSGRVNPNL